MMEYQRQADTARIVLGRYGGPARLKRPAVGAYDPVADAMVRPAAALAGDISATAVTLSLSGDVSSYPESGLLLLEDEIVFYSRLSGVLCSGLERGAEGTTAASHATGATATLTHACLETLAVALNYRREMVGGGVVEPGDRLLYLAATRGLTPAPGDLLRHGGREYRLEEVSDLAPDGMHSVYYEARGRAVEVKP